MFIGTPWLLASQVKSGMGACGTPWLKIEVVSGIELVIWLYMSEALWLPIPAVAMPPTSIWPGIWKFPQGFWRSGNGFAREFFIAAVASLVRPSRPGCPDCEP